MKKPKIFPHKAYTGPEQNRDQILSITEGVKNMHRTYNQAHVAILGKGVMMADEDAAALQPYSKTARVYSQSAEVLSMTMTDFIQRVRHNEETWNFI